MSSVPEGLPGLKLIRLRGKSGYATCSTRRWSCARQWDRIGSSLLLRAKVCSDLPRRKRCQVSLLVI